MSDSLVRARSVLEDLERFQTRSAEVAAPLRSLSTSSSSNFRPTTEAPPTVSSLASEVDAALNALHSRWAFTGVLPISSNSSAVGSEFSHRGASVDRFTGAGNHASASAGNSSRTLPPLSSGSIGGSVAALRNFNPGEVLSGRATTSSVSSSGALEAIEAERLRRIAAESRAESLRAEIASASIPPPNSSKLHQQQGNPPHALEVWSGRPPVSSHTPFTPHSTYSSISAALEEASASVEESARQARVAGLRSELESERAGNMSREAALRSEIEKERSGAAITVAAMEAKQAQTESALSALSLENSKMRVELEATAVECTKAISARNALVEENTRLQSDVSFHALVSRAPLVYVCVCVFCIFPAKM